jgi:hypothetical protein
LKVGAGYLGAGAGAGAGAVAGLRSSHRKHPRVLRLQVQEAVLESGSLDMRRAFDVSQLMATAYSFVPLCVRAVPSAPPGTQKSNFVMSLL